MTLFLSYFWIQIHDLPPGLMTEAMAKYFGGFLVQFVEYDTTIPTMGVQKYMNIRVRLDVIALSKRKKKILIGKDRVVYVRFQYEKLSLFFLFVGDLGIMKVSSR